ncbi:MAG TPA: hypothetical protein DDY13_01485 [Cytophagales bacterium]|jgi:hypothetical protein|nr:hypothetical protein [Cytophagales bacterium]
MKSSIAIFLFLILVIPQCVFAQSKKEIRYKQHYMDVNQRFYNNGQYSPLMKWNRDIKYTVAGNMDSYWNKRVVKIMDDVQELFPYRITFTSDKEEADLVIFLGNIQAYKLHYLSRDIELQEGSNNWFSFYQDNQNNLNFVSFCVDVESIDIRDFESYLMHRFILKGFGLMGYSDDTDSVFFNDWMPGNDRWSRKDIVALKIHYSEAFKSGMSREQVEDVIRLLPLSL